MEVVAEVVAVVVVAAVAMEGADAVVVAARLVHPLGQRDV